MVVNTETAINISEFIESHEWSKKLFSTNSAEHKQFLLNNDITASFSYIFTTAFKSFKSSPSTIDLIHRNIIDFISDTDLKLQIFSSILHHLSDQTLDTQHQINDLTLTQYYQNIIDDSTSPKHLHAHHYNCLSSIAKFNPFIIETKLPEILKKILFIKKSNDEDKSSYNLLLLDILDACTRLRRETKLVPWMLMAANQDFTSKICRLDINDILPPSFLDKFTNCVSSMTNSQIMNLLLSFTYHLDQLILQKNPVNVFMSLKISSKLIPAFFDGVNMFDNKTLIMQQKFTANLSKLGVTFQKLIDLISRTTNDNEVMLVSLLSIINSWEAELALIKKYACDALTEDTTSAISQSLEHIYQVINSQCLSQTTSNYLFQSIVCFKLEERKFHSITSFIDVPTDDHQALDLRLPENLEKCWEIILQKYPHLIFHMNDSQLECLAQFLLNDTRFDETNVLQFTQITHPVILKNERLVMELIFAIFSSITLELKNSASVTKKLLKIITKKKSWSKRMQKICSSCQELLRNDCEWSEIESESIANLVKCLQTLLLLPLINVSVETRTLIFLTAFSIGKEASKSKAANDLCSQIISDVGEYGNIDILQYFKPESLINELHKYQPMIKLLQCSLRNFSNYQMVEMFIKNNKSIESCAAPTLIQCIESIKPRLKANEKRIAGKIEKKLSKRILKALDASEGIKNAYEVKSLRAAVKVAIVSSKVDDLLIERIHSTLDYIFDINSVNKSKEDLKIQRNVDDALFDEGLQLIKLILHHQTHIKIDKKVVKCVWRLMMKNADENILRNLLSLTRPKLLKKVLASLQKQIVSSVKTKNDQLLQNSLRIWCSIASVTTGIRVNTIRHNNLQTLLKYFCKMSISNDHQLTLLKICTATVSAKKSQLPEATIDLILLTISNLINNQENLNVALSEEILEICLSFVKYRTSVISDRLPALLLIYRRLINFIVNESRKNPAIVQRELECLSLNAQKLIGVLVKLKRDISRISPYTIADLIEIYSKGVIPNYVKEPLDESVSMFLSICDQHGVSLLLRTLPVSMQEIFKTLYSTYTKFYKFTGKI